MNLSLGDRWEGFIADIVEQGRYGSASEVVREGLRLIEEREAKLLSLRDTLNASITSGGRFTDDEVAAALAGRSADLSKKR